MEKYKNVFCLVKIIQYREMFLFLIIVFPTYLRSGNSIQEGLLEPLLNNMNKQGTLMLPCELFGRL